MHGPTNVKCVEDMRV